MSLSANKIIQDALLEARVIYPGEPVGARLEHAKRILDRLLDYWAVDRRFFVYAWTLESAVTLTIGQSAYTYGTGGDIDSSRPNYISDMWYVRYPGSDSAEYRMRQIPLREYLTQRNKSVSGRPREFATNSEFPLARVFLWPEPDVAYELYPSSRKDVTSYSDLTTAVALPPGYERCIVLNLAVELLRSYGKAGKTSNKKLIQDAEEAVKTIQHNNASKEFRSLDVTPLARMTGLGRRYIRTDIVDV